MVDGAAMNNSEYYHLGPMADAQQFDAPCKNYSDALCSNDTDFREVNKLQVATSNSAILLFIATYFNITKLDYIKDFLTYCGYKWIYFQQVINQFNKWHSKQRVHFLYIIHGKLA